MSAPLADKFTLQHLYLNFSPGYAALHYNPFEKESFHPAMANLQLLV